MRANGLTTVCAALVAALLITVGSSGCKAQTVREAAGPRDASALQAEPPAAAAFREPTAGTGKSGFESLIDEAMPQKGVGAQAGMEDAVSPNDWHIITHSMSLFTHGPYVIDLLIGFILAIVMALLLTAWPKSLVARDPVAAVEERNGGIIVALVGCMAAELVQSSEQLTLGAEVALVLFGIGGLIRFRTVFGDPKRTGLMILITILGLCCGMSQYALAVMGFLVIWIARYFLLSSVRLVVRVRPRKNADMEQIRAAVTSLVAGRGATVLGVSTIRSGKALELVARTRGAVDTTDLRLALEDAVPGARVRVSAS